MLRLSHIIVTLSILLIGIACNNQSQSEGVKNVLVIVADDHAYTVAGCYGNTQIKTPNIDRLAESGVRFANAYSNSPICSASRQSLLTGKYPHATGVNLLFTPFNDDQNYTIAEHLQKFGFKTCMIGKTHYNDWIYWNYWETWPDYGFDKTVGTGDWKKYLDSIGRTKVPATLPTRENTPHENNVQWMKNAQVLPSAYYDKESEGTYFAGEAIRFLSGNDDQRKFVWLAFHEPHAPFNFPVEYAGKYNAKDMILPLGTEEDDRWVPEIFRNLTPEERKGIIAAYYTSVEYMDKNVGLVLDALKANHLDKNTLVIYLGDQGYLLNNHKRFEKHTMWAESVKAPLIISGAGLPDSEVIQNPVEFIDVASTICEAAGVPLFKELQGKSLMKLMKGETSQHKKYVFSEFLQDNKAMVASAKWKYIFTTGKREFGNGYATGFGPSGVIHRLYDLENDPGETHNLADQPELADTVKELQKVMLERFEATHPMAKFVPQGLNTVGRLIWFCEPNDVGAEPTPELERIFEE